MYDHVVKCQRAGFCLSEHFLIAECFYTNVGLQCVHTAFYPVAYICHKIWGSGSVRWSHQTVSDYTLRQRFPPNTQQSRFLTACRRLKKLVLPSTFDTSLSSLMTSNIQQQFRMKQCAIFRESKHTLWLLHIFRVSRPPPPNHPGSIIPLNIYIECGLHSAWKQPGSIHETRCLFVFLFFWTACIYIHRTNIICSCYLLLLLIICRQMCVFSLPPLITSGSSLYLRKK